MQRKNNFATDSNPLRSLLVALTSTLGLQAQSIMVKMGMATTCWHQPLTKGKIAGRIKMEFGGGPTPHMSESVFLHPQNVKLFLSVNLQMGMIFIRTVLGGRSGPCYNFDHPC